MIENVGYELAKPQKIKCAEEHGFIGRTKIKNGKLHLIFGFADDESARDGLAIMLKDKTILIRKEGGLYD